MMKFNEMAEERKIAVVVGNVLFWGGLLVELVVPGCFNRGILVGIEAAGVALELLAHFRFGRKAA